MHNILILQLNRLGDLVQTVPLMRALKQAHPGCRLTVVCLEEVKAVLEGNPWHDRLLCVRHAELEALTDPERRKGCPGAPPFDAPAFRERYDLLVNLGSDAPSASLCERLEAGRKLGRIETYAGELRLLGDWSKYLFSMVSHRTHNLFNLVDVFQGMAGLPPRPMDASLQVSPARREEAQALLRAGGLRGGRPLVALQAGASDAHRAWAPENFAALAARLVDGGAEVVLTGDGREQDLTARIRELAGRPLLDMAGKTPLTLLPALLKSCDLLVSNDTGTIHVAAGVGTPTLGLYFATAYYTETAPYGAGHAVLQVELPCSPCNASSRCPVQLCRSHLAVDAVLETARWMLDPALPVPAARPNLSLYRSRFLANGSLLYAPAHPARASRHYLTGLMGRLLWEEALGIQPEASLDESWTAVAPAQACEAERAATETLLAALEPSLDEGRATAARLRAQFAQPSPDRARVLELHSHLAGLGASFSQAAASGNLVGTFLHYEMMDLDYSPYPRLAELLEAKYGGLLERTRRFRSALARLAPRL